MSITRIADGPDFAKRNFWEATLFDHTGAALAWSTTLIKSVNVPKLTLGVEDIYNGATKAYSSWKLPDSISLSIWETSDHQVEKYLDEWMTGETGVLSTKYGVAFRTNPLGYLFRKLQVVTFIYEAEKEESLSIKASQYDAPQLQKTVNQQQVIPIVDKLASVANGLIQTVAAGSPLIDNLIPGASKVTGYIPSEATKFIPPLIVPIPTMKVPIPIGTGVSKYFTNDNYIDSAKVSKFPSKEKITSRITYTTAIESYDIGSYDYATGDGVSYTVNLAVTDIEIEHPEDESIPNGEDTTDLFLHYS